MKRLVLLFLCFAIGQAGFAQPPASNIYAISVVEEEGFVTLEGIALLTADNPDGYNNQPALMPDGSIYFARRQKDSAQTDIYAMEIRIFKPNLKTRITRSREDEYSPILHPDGKSFCCIRVEQDGTSQRLWKFPLDRSNPGSPLLPHITTAGYFHWMDDLTIALFQVGEPHRLLIHSLADGMETTVAENIGRTLLSDREGKLLYIDIFSDEYRYIKKYDPGNESSTIVKRIHNECGDFGYGPDGTYYIGQGSRILRFRPGIDHDWKEFLDLSTYGIRNITRIVPVDETEWLIVDQHNE